MSRVEGPRDPMPLTDLSRAWIATSDEVRAAVDRVLSRGWSVHGPEHTAFEAELAGFLQARHTIGVANGTDALLLALLAVGCEPGSEVVCVADAGGYASVAASRIGCGVVYADVGGATISAGAWPRSSSVPTCRSCRNASSWYSGSRRRTSEVSMPIGPAARH